MPTTNWNKRNKCKHHGCEEIISDEAKHCRRHTPGNKRPVEVKGEVYESVKAACEGLGICRSTLIYRLKSPKNKWTAWRYAGASGTSWSGRHTVLT